MHVRPSSPDAFVARDRARRFALRLEQALEDRKLAYLGQERGVTTLVNGAEEALATLVAEAAETIAEVDAGRVRDRERGPMEAPLLVLAEGLVARTDAILARDRARARGGADARALERAVTERLAAALARVDAYCRAYDEKRPAGPRRAADLGRILGEVEEDAAALAGAGRIAAPATERAAPVVQSDPDVLGDLLRAVRRALPGARGPWRIVPAEADRPLALELGDTRGAAEGAAPPAVARAASVLGFVHPVEVEWFVEPGRAGGLLSAPAGPPRAVGARCRIPDEMSGRARLVLETCGGEAACWPPTAQAAVRALLAAPPLPEAGSPPPARLVAIAGLLRALDESLGPALLPRAEAHRLREGVLRIPRESTRKAGVRRDLCDALAARFEEFPVHRVDDVVRRAAQGPPGARGVRPAEAAVLLALFGRRWRAAGRDLPAALDLTPLDDAGVEALVEDLCAVGVIRRELEAGRPVPPARVTRLERAALGALGRLGRLLAP